MSQTKYLAHKERWRGVYRRWLKEDLLYLKSLYMAIEALGENTEILQKIEDLEWDCKKWKRLIKLNQ